MANKQQTGTFTLQMECFGKNTRKNGGNVVFAAGISQQKTDKGAVEVARKTFTLQTTDPMEVDAFTIGETYTITISK